MVSAPNKYPVKEEKTTLNDNLILVISLKLEITELIVMEEFAVLDMSLISLLFCECKDTSKFSYEQS